MIAKATDYAALVAAWRESGSSSLATTYNEVDELAGLPTGHLSKRHRSRCPRRALNRSSLGPTLDALGLEPWVKVVDPAKLEKDAAAARALAVAGEAPQASTAADI